MENNYSHHILVALIIIGGILLCLPKAAHAASPTPLFLLQQQITGTVTDQNGLQFFTSQ